MNILDVERYGSMIQEMTALFCDEYNRVLALFDREDISAFIIAALNEEAVEEENGKTKETHPLVRSLGACVAGRTSADSGVLPPNPMVRSFGA